MEYGIVKEGLFLQRPNRFIAHVLVDGKEELCHVKNTGRCRELLLPGKSRVYVEDHGTGTNRKTRYSLIQVIKGERLINMDSQAPNQAAYEWVLEGAGGLLQSVDFIKPEYRFGDSRIDLYIEADHKKIMMEVKGVTLEEDNVARFPDAPTIRGLKHIYELCHGVEEGYEAYILFVIQMEKVRLFEPNYATHPAFGEALAYAREKGVHVVAVDCLTGKGFLRINDFVPVNLDKPEEKE